MLRNVFRSVMYLSPLHRILGLGKAKYDQAYWDAQLSGALKTYHGGTISVDTRNAIVLTLIRNIAPDAQRLLDVGCASGSLYRAPGGSDFNYVGTDISQVACEEGRKLSPEAAFHVSRLEDFVPDGPQDVIVLNEVLYYLSADDARAEVSRLSAYLAERGLIIVSMKHDPKSRAIFAGLRADLPWINGVLYQEKLAQPEYTIRKDAKRPAYLIGVFGKG